MTKEDLIKKLIDVDKLSSKINSATNIIVMSDILKSAVIKVGANEEKITVLGNRVDTSLFKPIFTKDKKGEKEIELLFVGRQEPQKNIHGVISAMIILISQGYKVRLDICGGGRKTPYTRSLLTKDVKKYCNYLGAIKNSKMPYLYNKVDMLVNPSFFEGFQIPLIEALACGVPVVTSDQEPGNKIISEETGALVDPTDPKDIARGVLSVKNKLNDPIKRQEIKTRCRIEALTKWDYYLISKKEVETYKKVLGINSSGVL
jgi:glycosyltransferase involved in cell wall biosynthesis